MKTHWSLSMKTRAPVLFDFIALARIHPMKTRYPRLCFMTNKITTQVVVRWSIWAITQAICKWLVIRTMQKHRLHQPVVHPIILPFLIAIKNRELSYSQRQFASVGFVQEKNKTVRATLALSILRNSIELKPYQRSIRTAEASGKANRITSVAWAIQRLAGENGTKCTTQNSIG